MNAMAPTWRQSRLAPRKAAQRLELGRVQIVCRGSQGLAALTAASVLSSELPNRLAGKPVGNSETGR